MISHKQNFKFLPIFLTLFLLACSTGEQVDSDEGFQSVFVENPKIYPSDRLPSLFANPSNAF